MIRAVVLALVLTAGLARAEPVVLRLASAVPEGTAWARVGRAFARDVEKLTRGEVRVKWYLGGIAGDELEMQTRIARDQLDGVGSGGMLCTRLAPSMRVMRMAGLVQNRDESALVLRRLKPALDEEFRANGFTSLWEAGLGTSFLFARQPVHSLAEMRRERWWLWNLDEVFISGLRSVGLTLIPTPLEEAARAYDEKRHDGFISSPVAALAFQWSVQARYMIELPTGFLPACLLVTSRAFDALSSDAQKIIREAGATFQQRMEDVGREQEEALMGGLFAKQGLKAVPVSAAFREEWEAAARAARARETLVAPELRQKVEGWLKEFRAGKK
jgi:TRAP-type C4-dicarboxylate transport system substrate-binding protein